MMTLREIFDLVKNNLDITKEEIFNLLKEWDCFSGHFSEIYVSKNSLTLCELGEYNSDSFIFFPEDIKLINIIINSPSFKYYSIPKVYYSQVSPFKESRFHLFSRYYRRADRLVNIEGRYNWDDIFRAITEDIHSIFRREIIKSKQYKRRTYSPIICITPGQPYSFKFIPFLRGCGRNPVTQLCYKLWYFYGKEIDSDVM